MDCALRSSSVILCLGVGGRLRTRSHGWHVGSRIARGACRVRLLGPVLEGALGWWSPQGFRVDRLLIGNFGRCFLHGLGSKVFLIPMLLMVSTPVA